MITAHLLTGLAWTKPITLDCDINGDISKALDDFYAKEGKEGFPVYLYETSELTEEDINAYIAINGGQYWIMGIAGVEEVVDTVHADLSMEDYQSELYADVVQLAGEAISVRLLGLLRAMGYFTSPASHKYHGCYPGGLCKHSLAVAKALVKLTADNNLTWSRPESPILVGLLHDICKMDSYIEFADWDGTGERYSFNRNTEIKGHGDKSVSLADMIGFNLTKEEELCIRWHMGAYEGKHAWENFGAAVSKMPNVLWTHQADMIASKIEGV